MSNRQSNTGSNSILRNTLGSVSGAIMEDMCIIFFQKEILEEQFIPTGKQIISPNAN